MIWVLVYLAIAGVLSTGIVATDIAPREDSFAGRMLWRLILPQIYLTKAVWWLPQRLPRRRYLPRARLR